MAFGELVRSALATLEEAVAERGATVEVAPGLPAVCGDRPRLEELLRHLILNALLYVDASRAPRIEIGARPQGGDRIAGWPIFFVRDNGIGIDPRYHEKIFDLFERLDLEASEGTGIGLALVKRIVEVHGGRVWVESEGRGHGSNFCFTLRPADADAGVDAEPTATEL